MLGRGKFLYNYYFLSGRAASSLACWHWKEVARFDSNSNKKLPATRGGQQAFGPLSSPPPEAQEDRTTWRLSSIPSLRSPPTSQETHAQAFQLKTKTSTSGWTWGQKPLSQWHPVYLMTHTTCPSSPPWGTQWPAQPVPRD